MNIKENIRIALFSIRTNIMRSLLTMLGIIIGVASVIAVITVGNGGRDYIVGMIRDLGANVVSITVNTASAEDSDYITSDDIEAVRKLESIRYITPVTMSMGTLDVEGKGGLGMALGTDEQVQYLLKGGCKYGRYYNEEEIKSGRPVAVVDITTAKMLFGYENVVGQMLDYSVNGRSERFKIIGVTDLMSTFGGDSDQMVAMMDSMGGGMMGYMFMVPSSVASTLSGREDQFEMCYFSSQDEGELDAAGQAALNLLQTRHNNAEREVYTVQNMATYIDLLDTVIRVFTIFIAAVSAISLIVGGIGVMNIMLVTVTERTREIGIRKALGAKTSNIMFQFLTESIVLCLIGGIIGTILGVSGASLVSHLMNVPLGVDFSTILIAIGFSSAIGIFFGIYPARRAAKMQPIEALRRE